MYVVLLMSALAGWVDSPGSAGIPAAVSMQRDSDRNAVAFQRDVNPYEQLKRYGTWSSGDYVGSSSNSVPFATQEEIDANGGLLGWQCKVAATTVWLEVIRVVATAAAPLPTCAETQEDETARVYRSADTDVDAGDAYLRSALQYAPAEEQYDKLATSIEAWLVDNGGGAHARQRRLLLLSSLALVRRATVAVSGGWGWASRKSIPRICSSEDTDGLLRSPYSKAPHP